jgi:hypothetical protein
MFSTKVGRDEPGKAAQVAASGTSFAFMQIGIFMAYYTIIEAPTH